MEIRHIVELVILIILLGGGLSLHLILGRRVEEVRDDGRIMKKKDLKGKIIDVRETTERYEKLER